MLFSFQLSVRLKFVCNCCKVIDTIVIKMREFVKSWNLRSFCCLQKNSVDKPESPDFRTRADPRTATTHNQRYPFRATSTTSKARAPPLVHALVAAPCSDVMAVRAGVFVDRASFCHSLIRRRSVRWFRSLCALLRMQQPTASSSPRRILMCANLVALVPASSIQHKHASFQGGERKRVSRAEYQVLIDANWRRTRQRSTEWS